MAPNPFSFFTDSILRAPTLGCMLMCLTASLIGVVVVLRKQSLIGEALSHASYPGIILGVIFAGALSIEQELIFSLLALSCAFLSAMGGLAFIHALIKYVKVPPDAALCFVLSTFFGIGLTLTSEVQFSFTSLYKQVLTYFYGQAATMTDIHIAIYGIFALITLVFLVLFYKEIQVMAFDRHYAKSLGLSVKPIETVIFFLMTAAIIIGIRSVGVILISSMLIAPAVAARQLTNRLSLLFLLAGVFGMLSGFFGNYFSVYLTDLLANAYPSARIILPTGPMIVLSATAICIAALLLAPERGLFVRLWRMRRFRSICLEENILKRMWNKEGLSFEQISHDQSISKLYLRWILHKMKNKGSIDKGPQGFRLTPTGNARAANIVRLHRLWELYLAHYLEMGAERVHRNAEEMEHILTPEIEQELVRLLNDPKQDPHHQPIPAKEDYAQ